MQWYTFSRTHRASALARIDNELALPGHVGPALCSAESVLDVPGHHVKDATRDRAGILRSQIHHYRHDVLGYHWPRSQGIASLQPRAILLVKSSGARVPRNNNICRYVVLFDFIREVARHIRECCLG